jgi:16S rRNA (cytosine967-C5)-methyltransferase
VSAAVRASSVYGHIAELLDAVAGTRQPADKVASDFFRTRHYLGSRDRRTISDRFYAIIRFLRLLEARTSVAWKAAAPSTPIPRRTPSMALVVAHAAVMMCDEPAALLAEAGGLWRVTIPDVDCALFLHALATAPLPAGVTGDPATRISIEQSFPRFIVGEWIDRFGADETELLCRALNEPAPTSLRVNTLKCTREECRGALERDGVPVDQGRYAPDALTLRKRVNLQTLRAYKDGWCDVQDEGSQLLGLLVEPQAGMAVADACAGGGGKTIHLAALMGDQGSILSIDVDAKRLESVVTRSMRAGATIVRTMRVGEHDPLPPALMGAFDAVLVDAPCSGVGTFRRNPNAKNWLDEKHVDALARLQRSLLSRYAQLVTSGGRLVYGTCTLLRRENEDVVEAFLREHGDFRLLRAVDILSRQGVHLGAMHLGPMDLGALDSHFLRLFPHRTHTDGFFAAVMSR